MKRRSYLALLLLLALSLSGTLLTQASADQQSSQTSLVAQAFENDEASKLQVAAKCLITSDLGLVNNTHGHLCQWTKADLVENIIANIEQLVGKWLSEFIDESLANTVERSFRIVGLAVMGTGLDSIQTGAGNRSLPFYLLYLAQGFWAINLIRKKPLVDEQEKLTQTMGLIALFPFCMRAFWLCNMLMWWQIHARCDFLMDGYALAQAVKGGVIASGAFATLVFSPLLASCSIPLAAQSVGCCFYFCSIIVFTGLVMVLISQMMRVVPMMILRTTAAFVLAIGAPYFLAAHAQEGKGKLCIDFFRVYSELSLWQLFWLAILNEMSIVLHANLSPWLKIILCIGLLTVMQRLPRILKRARLSPVSQWLETGRKEMRRVCCRIAAEIWQIIKCNLEKNAGRGLAASASVIET